MKTPFLALLVAATLLLAGCEPWERLTASLCGCNDPMAQSEHEPHDDAADDHEIGRAHV